MYNGWLNLDKPYGITSFQAISRVKSILNLSNKYKVGHAGTLDPLASGVLPLAFGEATKVVSYAINKLKSYNFQVQWGKQRDTDDLEGNVIAESDLIPTKQQIEASLYNFIGNIDQIPPKFSSIKQNGIRMYALARAGHEPIMKARPVYIKKLELLDFDRMKNQANFSITCGKGVYIRSIARDLGTTLQCFGHVSYLRRSQVGEFKEDNSVTLSKLEQLYNSGLIGNCIYPIDFVLKDIPKIDVDEITAKKIKNGQIITLNNLCSLNNYDICYFSMNGYPIAIGKVYNNAMKAIRVFNI